MQIVFFQPSGWQVYLFLTPRFPVFAPFFQPSIEYHQLDQREYNTGQVIHFIGRMAPSTKLNGITE